MKVDIRRDLTSATLTFWMIRKRFLGVLLVVFASTPIVQGQQINSTSGINEQTMQALLRRIEQLEAADKELRDRVAQLEGAQHGSTQGSTPPSPAPIDTKETHRTIPDSVTPATAQVAVSPETPAQHETTAPDRIDFNSTLLNIRGFGDFGFGGQTLKGSTTSFSLGQVDFFITSDISERFRFLTDLVFEKGIGNDFEEDLERVLLEYTHSDYLKLSLGRSQTAIGYYNLA